MGLRAIYRRPRTSQQAPEHRVYPYLLRNARVNQPNQVWATDITYLPIARGFLSAPMAQNSAALDRVGGEGGRPERFPILRLPSEKFAVSEGTFIDRFTLKTGKAFTSMVTLGPPGTRTTISSTRTVSPALNACARGNFSNEISRPSARR